VAAPADENELQHMLYTATQCGQPMVIRYPRGTGTGLNLDRELKMIPIGKAQLIREGSDVLFVATGASVNAAIEAAGMLEEQGHYAAIINMRFINPLDTDLLREMTRSIKKVITIEENVLSGGLGSRVALFLEITGIKDVDLRCLAIPDEFVKHGTQSQLRADYHLDARGINQEAVSFINQSYQTDQENNLISNHIGS
jgi:1-deoxy-D-xylulose-5-phosphate synthase